MENQIIVKRNRSGTQKKPLIVVVSSKAVKRAVDRNRLKRRIREIMRPYVKRGDYDYTVIARPGAAELSFEKLRNLLNNK